MGRPYWWLSWLLFIRQNLYLNLGENLIKVIHTWILDKIRQLMTKPEFSQRKWQRERQMDGQKDGLTDGWTSQKQKSSTNIWWGSTNKHIHTKWMSNALILLVQGYKRCVFSVPILHYLFVLLLYVPVNNFSVIMGWIPVFWGWTRIKQWMKCLAQGHNTVTLMSLELGNLHS